MAAISKAAKYKTTVRDPGISGVLKMAGERFVFTPNDPRSSAKVDVGFKNIKVHKFSKDGSRQALLNLIQNPEKGVGYMFEFDNFPDRDACRDFVGNVLGRLQPMVTSTPKNPASPERPSASVHGEQISSTEMERRLKLLQDDIELQKLHRQFVISGVLSESEFWATRKNLLDDTHRTSKQRAGFKSAMIADVRPLTDGRTNKVTFSLTPEIIHQEKCAVDICTHEQVCVNPVAHGQFYSLVFCGFVDLSLRCGPSSISGVIWGPLHAYLCYDML